MNIHTRILRAMATDCDPHPRVLTSRQLNQLERIRVIGQKLFAAHGPQNIRFAQFAEALDINPRVLKHYYVDLHALAGDLIRRHLMELSAELGKIPYNAENRAAKLRKAYYNFTHTALGALTEAHLLATRDTHLLPDDERLPIETIQVCLGQNIAGAAGLETRCLLDTAFLSLDRIEALLNPGAPPREAAPPQPVDPQTETVPTAEALSPKDPVDRDDIFDLDDYAGPREVPEYMRPLETPGARFLIR